MINITQLNLGRLEGNLIIVRLLVIHFFQVDFESIIFIAITQNPCYMLDCLLINPAEPPATYPPLGICYLAAVLQQNNISVKILDNPALGLSTNKILQNIRQLNPKIVGITVMSSLLPQTYRLIQGIQQQMPDVVIVVGGPYITVDPEVIIDMNVSYGFRGDAELAFPAFCKAIIENRLPSKEIPGILINENGLVYKAEPALYPNLNDLPTPAYDLLDLKKYRSSEMNYLTASMIISRGGCPYTCTFCGNLMKEKYRRIDAVRVVDQIEYLMQEFGTQLIEFVDETFTLNRNRTKDLCNEIINRGIKIRWICLTRVDNLDEELLLLMKRSGCYKIRFGVESGNEQVRYRAQKNISNKKFEETLALCRKIGIKTLCFYIFGFPGETEEQMNQTLEYSFFLPSDTNTYSRMEPIPNSEIFNLALQQRKIHENVWRDFMKGKSENPIYYPENVSPEFMNKIYKKAYIRYYTSSRALSSFAPMFLSIGFWLKALHFARIILLSSENLP